MNELLLREKVCEIGRLLWDRHLIGALEGNISCRLSPTQLLCTPAGRNKGFLKPSDLVTIDVNGSPTGGGQPTSEIRLHLECYAQRPDCQAVVHAHPSFATAFALAGRSLPGNLLPEAAVILGDVPLVPFAMPGTDAMRDSIRPFLPHHEVFLLANHGALAIGHDLDQAFGKMDTLERVAAVVFRAMQIDKPVPLSPEVCESLRKLGPQAKLEQADR